MIKQQANNSFAEGLMMDLNPLVTPNTVMTNCLNGTLVTFNGNEYILLNDMGNGRVETAYLPEGYVPMGTCELGGIIYIVSYNPLKGTCQIGSFPSPERNITSDESRSSEVSLSNSDFQWDSASGAGVYYLKKDLDADLKFSPGDKFIVYSSNVANNKGKLYELTTPDKQTVKLSLGTVTEDGRLVTFDTESLKEFTVTGTSSKYHIKDHSGGSSQDVDLDAYRELTSQPYNIFSSKVSGTLVLIAELVLFDSFSTNIKHQLNTVSSNKVYTPRLTMDFSGSYEHLPYGIQKHFDLVNDLGQIVVSIDEEETLGLTLASTIHSVLKNLISNPTQLSSELGTDYFTKPAEERAKFTLNYKITPCMIWGPVKHLASEGSIALHNIGSGIIELSAWKYYNSDTRCNLTWGLNVYEEEDKSILGVNITLTRLLSSSSTEILQYPINQKSSYHGTFYEIIPLGLPYYKFNNETLYQNLLYLAKITVLYGNNSGSENRTYYRWLYTSPVFNDYYTSETDFKDLSLTFDTEIDFKFKETVTSLTLDRYVGFLRGKKTDGVSQVDSIKTMSVLRNKRGHLAKCSAKVSFKKDHNIFGIKCNGSTLGVAFGSRASLEISSKNKYTEREDENLETYLANEINPNWDGSMPNLPNSATSPETAASATAFVGDSATYKNGVKVLIPTLSPMYNIQTDRLSFNVPYTSVGIVKAYAVLGILPCTSNGKIIPLAYDNNTFADYNLKFENSTWKPIRLGTFGFFERADNITHTKGHCFIGYAQEASNLTSFQDFEFSTANNVDFNWTGDSEILAKYQQAGWSAGIVFAAHHCSANDNDQQLRWINTSNRKSNSYNGVTTNDSILSRDSRKYSGGKNIVHVLMKSNVDSYYYPINCAKVGSATYLSSYYGSGWSPLYNHLALVFNNLFRYVNESEVSDYWVPNLVQYGDEYVYTIRIPINYTLNKDNGKVKAVALIKLGNQSYLTLERSIISKYDPAATTASSLFNNISYVINDNVSGYDHLLVTSIKDNASGITLRNLFLALMNSNLGTAVCGYDGKSLGDYITGNFNPRYIYCKNDQGEVVEATAFKPQALSYSLSATSLLLVSKSSGRVYNTQTTYNISKFFTLDDFGILRVKDPIKSELTLRRYGKHDKGYVYGYLKRGLSPDYEFWK